MTDPTRTRAEALIQSVFLANEKGWREWYALTNSGQLMSAPDGTAARLVDALTQALDAERQAAREEAARVADGQALSEQILWDCGRQKPLHRHGRHIASTIALAIRQQAQAGREGKETR